MVKLNTASSGRKGSSPLKTVSSVPTARTHEGGLAYVSDEKSELFRLGANLFAGEDTYYESGKDRNTRFSTLVKSVAVSDFDWLAGFLGWLRSDGNIRTASVMGAVDAVNARLAAGLAGGNRGLITSVIQRPDELREVLAYQTSTYGRAIPKPVKRGVSDAAARILDEYAYLKWDGGAGAWRMSDVIEMIHAHPESPEQAELYRLIVNERHGNDYSFDESLLPMIQANRELRRTAAADPTLLLNPKFLRAAGFTWEDALSLAGSKIDKGQLWSALIMGGSVGHMAAIRNLRNMQEAGISKEATDRVIHIIADEDRVAKGRQFPFRYWTAYREAKGSQWMHPLEVALNYSTQNIPELAGETLVLIDTSGSMSATMSGKSKVRMDEAAALYGAAVAVKNAGRVSLHMFADRTMPIPVKKGDSVLRVVDYVNSKNGVVGYGTETVAAVRSLWNGHKRVFIFSDGQSFPDHSGNRYYAGRSGATIDSVVPKDVQVYAWNLAGYKHVDVPSGESTRHQLGGLTDGMFHLPKLIEAGHAGKWPWEMKK